MGLAERLREDMQRAAKERDSLALSALRMALAAVKNREIELRGALTDEAVARVLGTMIKQRREAADLYRKGGRPELAEKEEREIAVLSAYLPQPLSGAELERLAREAVAEVGAAGPQDAGRVMKVLAPRIAGRADGRAAAELVRRLLSG